jgi:hypothetical protein
MAIGCVSGHRAFIHDRGGVRRLFEVTDLTRVKWSRVRDDISEAEIDLDGDECQAQASYLEQIEPGRHELVIFRGLERVWEGPITRIAYTGYSVSIFAKDVLHYAFRTAMHAGYSSAYPNVEYGTNRIERIFRGELNRKEALTPPVNVLPFLANHHKITDAKTTRTTKPYDKTVFEEMDDMAAKAGVDYTVVGRAIHLWDTHESAMGQTATVTENDFLGDITVSVYGMELATATIVTDGEGTYGKAGGIDPYYGEWEMLVTSETEEGEDTPTQAVLQEQAQRNLSGRNPTPLQVRVPDNSSLNPNGVLSMSDLVPGVWIPLRATTPIRSIQQMQKLNSMSVTESAEGEDINITMYPAAGADDVAEGD